MKRSLFFIVFLVVVFSLSNLSLNAQESKTQVLYPTSFSITRPLRDLARENPAFQQVDKDEPWESPDRQNRPHQTFIYTSADGPEYGNDPNIIQTANGFRDISSRAPLQNWAGQSSSAYPPDPTGAAGPNHYIQIVNSTPCRIYNKTGTTLLTFTLGTIWNPDVGNAGDPIVMYDQYADRWFLSQFGSSNEIYIAISTTNDPTGSYYTYTYTSPQFPDYLKFSIWENGYYMTSNQSTDKVFCFERDQMLIGNPSARSISANFTTGSVSAFFCPLPADASDGGLPPAGTPLPFFAYYDNAWGGGTDGVKIWNMTVNWSGPSASISSSVQVNTSAFDASYNSSWNDCPQPGTSQMLDGIGGVLTYRAPWRPWSGYNSVVLNWGVLISSTPRERDIFWCELRQDQGSGTWSLYQQGIYDIDAATTWMGSIAQDDNGSIALCYTKSDATSIYPGLYYTGRLAGDPLGQMTFAETQAVAGSSSQNSINRFGDYAHTSLDPDGITFWHTGEYFTGSSGQETRIYSFQLPAGALAPVANFTAASTAPVCSSTVQFTDMSTNSPTSWLWNFGDGQTSTLQNPSHTYATNGTFTVSLTATNITGNDSEVKTNYITINTPLPPTATGASRCGTGTVTLSASGTATLNWYDVLTGGTSLGSGTSFTTPPISTTTTYYVENAQTYSPVAGGLLDNSGTGGYFTNTQVHGLYFNCNEACTLVSVDIYAGAAGNKTISIPALGLTGTFNLANGFNTVTLNWAIPAGSNYLFQGPASPNLYRNGSSTGPNLGYPFDIGGMIDITSSTAVGYENQYYYYFYNWIVQKPSCVATPRTPAVATVNPSVTPSVAISASAGTICSGTSVTFTATPTNGGTPSYQWQRNGINVGTNSTTYTTSALADGDVITCQMTSTASCASPTSVTSNSVTMVVNAIVTPSVSISASATNICSGNSVTFTATPTNGGTPSYQWKRNGTNVGSNSITYTTSTLADGDAITCVMTSTASCATPASATSNSVTITVSPNVTPAVSVSASSTNICAGQSVTFTATPSNGGTPAYQWTLNGINAGTNSATYVSTSLADGDVIACVMTSTATCASPTTANSNTVTMNVNPSVSPAVSISASANNICSGTGVTFTAVPTNGGTPTYQWQLNGISVGTNSSTYTNSALADGDVITCVMSSTATCAVPTSGTSNSVTMMINSSVVPSVAVSASATSICSGTNVVFTATPTNGGTPIYQWQLNGSNVGTNSSSYSNATLANGDIVRCIMTSSEACASPASALSNAVTITVVGTLTPAVSINASATAICTGSNVNFTATPTNGGTPDYQWYLNGATVGSNSASYSNNGLADGDIVYCIMTSTESCASPTTASSNNITIAVVSSVAPAVSIAASATSICTGTNVSFTASPTNGGTPTYQWLLNGINVGTNSPTYNNAGLADGDIVSCMMTSSESCASPTSATSNTISMVVNASLVPTVAVSASATTICTGTPVTFTASPTNGGAPSYQWLLNGSNVGSNSPTYTTSSLASGDYISCVMTSSESCALPATVSSNTVNMIVNSSLTPAVTVTPSATTICTGSLVSFTASSVNGGTPVYQWLLNGFNVGTNSSSYSNSGLSDGDVVSCIMTSSESCASPSTATSNSVTITVSSSVTPAVSIVGNPTTICAGTSVAFTATPTNGGTPTYQWQVNGSNAGTNNPVFISSSLMNGDVVTCIMSSSESCASPTAATSNAVSITVSSSITPSVSVISSATSICNGDNVTFYATPVNGGTPTYQWTLNGSNVGTNSNTFSTTNLADGDIVNCVMISSESCASPSAATSNSITISVNPSLTPAVSIAASDNNVCEGIPLTFTATPVNGGTPSYIWLVNSTVVASGTNTYSSSTLLDGDVVCVVMSSTASCAYPVTVVSNALTMTIYPNVVPDVAISSSPAGAVCPGTTKVFTANPAFGGSSPTYSWTVDGVAAGVGPTLSGVYTNGQVIGCTMVSNASCASPLTVNAMPVTVSVYAVTPVAVTESAGTLISSATSGNQWYEQSIGILLGETNQTFTPLVNGNYYTLVTDSNGCVVMSNVFNMTSVGLGDASAYNLFSVYPNPTPDIVSLSFARNITNGKLIIENALGQKVFEESVTQAAGTKRLLDLGSYASGVYFIVIYDQATEYRQKVVLDR